MDISEMENNKFIFWGTGSLAKNVYTKIELQKINVVISFFCDNNVNKVNTKCLGKKVYHANEIKGIKQKDHIIVICSSAELDIINQLKKLGFKENVDFVTQSTFNNFIKYVIAKEKIQKYSDIKIIVGAANLQQKGWISTDVEFLNLLNKEDWVRLLLNKKVTSIFAEHVWEHLNEVDGIKAIEMCYEFLREGGSLRIAVPDGNNPNKAYIDWVKPGGYGDGASDHKILYNVDTLKSALLKGGFKKIKEIEYFNAEGKFIKNELNLELGEVRRSKENDYRNWDGELIYTSLIIDAIK